MSAAPVSLYLSSRSTVRQLLDQGFEFDLIDAHYAYPDGVAAALLGREFNRPVVITARGSDVNLIPQYAIPRRWILWAARRAARMITVSAALKDALIALGVDAAKIVVLRNGVDLELFKPTDTDARQRSVQSHPWRLISVGNLVPLKGHRLIIQAMPQLPAATLQIIGEGPERGALEALAQQLKVQDRVFFLGPRAHTEMPALYGNADCLVLASEREGWPNVLLESMACGTPVIAPRVGGIPEIIAGPEAGELLEERTPESIVAALARLSSRNPSREATRRYAENFSWDATTHGQLTLFNEVVSSYNRA